MRSQFTTGPAPISAATPRRSIIFTYSNRGRSDVRNEIKPPSFDEIAVALKLAATKLRLDLDQMEILAASITLSPMGTSLAVSELKKNLDLVVLAHEFFKDGAAVEPQMRAVLARRKTGRWFPSLSSRV